MLLLLLFWGFGRGWGTKTVAQLGYKFCEHVTKFRDAKTRFDKGLVHQSYLRHTLISCSTTEATAQWMNNWLAV